MGIFSYAMTHKTILNNTSNPRHQQDKIQIVIISNYPIRRLYRHR